MAERVKTGIAGFDKLVDGGFVENSVNLIAGGPGCGKTLFCLQFLWNGATKFDESGVFISFEENVDDLKKDAIAFGWDFNSLKKAKVDFVYFHPYDVGNLFAELEKLITKSKAKRIVIDSTSVYGMAFESKFEVRKGLYELSELLKSHDCVSLLTSEIVEDGDKGSKYSRFGVEEFLSDSIIVFSFESMGGEFSRSLQVRKIRRSKNDDDIHPLEISKNGLVVHDIK